MPDGLYRVEWRGNLQGQYRDNVMHWKITGEASDTPYSNAEALLAFLNTTIKPLWLLAMPPDYSLDALFARRIGPTSGNYSAIDYQPFTQIGIRGTMAVSQQLCPCVTLIPPMGIKSAGKIFLPAVDKGDINMNVYLAGYVTAVNNLINACVAGGSVAGGAATLCIFSRKLNTTSVIAGFHLSPVLGYQRKRARPIGV